MTHNELRNAVHGLILEPAHEYVCSLSDGCDHCENTGRIYPTTSGDGWNEPIEVEWVPGSGGYDDDSEPCSAQFYHVDCEGCGDDLDAESIACEKPHAPTFHLHDRAECFILACAEGSITEPEALATFALHFTGRRAKA